MNESAHVTMTPDRIGSLLLAALVVAGIGSCGTSPEGTPPNPQSPHDAGAPDATTLQDASVAAMGTGDAHPTQGGAEAGPPDGSTDAGPPLGMGDGPVGVVAVPLSGCYGAHTAPVTIGNMGPFALNIDTGSSTVGVASQSCAECADAGVAPLYVPGASAVDLQETVKVAYDTGELGWSGEGYRDTVALGGVGAPVRFAAIESQQEYFFADVCDSTTGGVPGPYQGIVGFGPASLEVQGTDAYFDQVVGNKAVPDVFALQLCHVGGTLWLGGYDADATTGAMRYTPMGTTQGYTVDWAAVTVGPMDTGVTVKLAGSAGQTMIDSGGWGWILPDESFQPLAKAIGETSSFATLFGPDWLSSSAPSFSQCVTLDQTPGEVDALLPTVTLTLGAESPVTVELTATESYLTYSYLGSQVTYCQALVDGTPAYGSLYYLGQSLMLNHVLVYDRAQHRFGIAPGQPCVD